jgi:hypothetical protein
MNMTTTNQNTLQAIKDATVETVTIEIAGEYADIHPVAQALAIGDNASAILKDLIEASQDNATARSEIIEIWDDMASLGKLATIRTLLNRLSKAVLGFPLTVKDGQLIAAQTRAKASKETTEATEATEATETAGMTEYEIDKAYDLERFKKWFEKADDAKRCKVFDLIAELG